MNLRGFSQKALASKGFHAEIVPSPGQGLVELGALTGVAGLATSSARAFAGQLVSVSGYLSATSRPRRFLLSEECPAYCQMCGMTHESGPSVMLDCLDDTLAEIPPMRPVAVSGTVAISDGPHSFQEPQVRLERASGRPFHDRERN